MATTRRAPRDFVLDNEPYPQTTAGVDRACRCAWSKGLDLRQDLERGERSYDAAVERTERSPERR